jgi:hypothetical protein
MDAFERNKYNEMDFIREMVSESIIVAYGFISSLDFDNNVTVTLAVSSRSTADRVKCTFMNIGFEGFTLSIQPEIGMRVLVLAPHKAANGMYDSFAEINISQGREYIMTGSPASYSSQSAMCLPVVKSTVQSINSFIIDNTSITAEFKNEIIMAISGPVELDIMSNTNIELHNGTKHFRGYYGDLEETFGFFQGLGGAEQEGEFKYVETYGKHSSVEKNYESGIKTVIGKAYEKPFLEDKGELLDSSAPVTIELGASAPVTLKFGDNLVTVKADTQTGIDIALKGALKVSISAETGKIKLSNSTGSLKELIDKIADLCATMSTIGPNVVVGVPYAAVADPATIVLANQVKTLAAGLLE